MKPPYRLKVTLPPGLQEPGWRRKQQMVADAMARQTADRIEAGGDDEVTIPPTADGRTALVGSGGLLAAIAGYVTEGAAGVKVVHPGARALLLGTTGKGGALPPIRPKRARFLSWVADGVRRFAKEVNLPPRKYLRLSKENARELLGILAGRRRP